MANIPPDPLDDGGIARFADEFRTRRTSSESVTAAYLARIEALDARLGAYEHVARDRALAQARALDALLAAGTDLGPLMGVPVAIKDLIAVTGMPTTAGSNVDVEDLIGSEGPFVSTLKRAGCVILGKTKTVEFAMGGSGVNLVRGTPWNPWDATTHRIPGGSSSGSAVAAAAGLCAFAIGSDTGGSVRIPAFSGTFALKTTKGLWPTENVSSLAASVDTLGPITRTAADAASVFAALQNVPTPRPSPPRGLRLGRPTNYFFDDLDADVERCVDAALKALAEAGVEIVDVALPFVHEHRQMIFTLCTVEFIAWFGRDRFIASREMMDGDVWARLAPGLDIAADDYIRVLWALDDHRRMAAEEMAGLDGLVTPTNDKVAMAIADLSAPDPASGRTYIDQMGRNTYSANILGLCATTTPVHGFGSNLPVGLQVMCQGFAETRALSIALLMEDLFGPPPRPDLSGFAS